MTAAAYEGPPYEVTFMITVDDIVAYVRLLQRRLSMIGVVLGLVVMTLGGIVAIAARDPFTGAWTFAVGLLFVLLSGTEYLDRWRIKRAAKSLIGAQPSYRFDQKGVASTSSLGSGRVPWSDIDAIVENERVLILKRGRNPVVWIPKRAFATADEAQALAAFIRVRIGDSGSSKTR